LLVIYIGLTVDRIYGENFTTGVNTVITTPFDSTPRNTTFESTATQGRFKLQSFVSLWMRNNRVYRCRPGGRLCRLADCCS
uniref:Uncharacterized protein n=1 Tax=Romanomermis culicivorax TaxID=13658 RepID=A0A915HWI2_ROMCU